MLIENIEPQRFLHWLTNRLKFKYKEDDSVLIQINNLLDNYQIFPKKISLEIIDKICKKYYPDFEMEKVPEMNIGYTTSERVQIRNFVIGIIQEVQKTS